MHQNEIGGIFVCFLGGGIITLFYVVCVCVCVMTVFSMTRVHQSSVPPEGDETLLSLNWSLRFSFGLCACLAASLKASLRTFSAAASFIRTSQLCATSSYLKFSRSNEKGHFCSSSVFRLSLFSFPQRPTSSFLFFVQILKSLFKIFPLKKRSPLLVPHMELEHRQKS